MEHHVGLFLSLVMWQLLVNHSEVPGCDAEGAGHRLCWPLCPAVRIEQESFSSRGSAQKLIAGQLFNSCSSFPPQFSQ